MPGRCAGRSPPRSPGGWWIPCWWGAVVEARSCERFAGLAEVMGGELGHFYARLLASEARHFEDYLRLAETYAPAPIEERLERLLVREAELVQATDTAFRFHSGPLAA